MLFGGSIYILLYKEDKENNMFERIDYYAGDPILGLMEKFLADSNPKK